MPKKPYLLGCPFCGGEAGRCTVTYSENMVREQKWTQDKFHYVNCIHCGVSNIGLRGYDTELDAAHRWNKRA